MSTYCVYEYVLHSKEQLLDIDQGGFDIHGKLVLSPSASPYHTQSHLIPPPHPITPLSHLIRLTLSHPIFTPKSASPYHTNIIPFGHLPLHHFFPFLLFFPHSKSSNTSASSLYSTSSIHSTSFPTLYFIHTILLHTPSSLHSPCP